MARQVLDPLDHGPVGPVQIRGLLPISALGRQGLGWQHQVVLDVSSYDQSSLQLSHLLGLMGTMYAIGPLARSWK
jgi:hypothetical protein